MSNPTFLPHTHSGKIPSSNYAHSTPTSNIHAILDPQASKYQEAGTDYATFTKLHQIVYTLFQNGHHN
jgi:hypothetical protein